tara:strand:- start:3 stop:428 length:426 start_codon:yes stop_codon:yes gene_type:complete
MNIKYLYADIEHDTVEEAQASVLVEKNLLDTAPINWSEVKVVTGNDTDSWLIPPVKLNDAEINNIDDTKTYMVASLIGGENLLGVSSSVVTEKVSSYRTEYATYKQVEFIYRVDLDATTEADISAEYEEIPTDIDMSGYVS